MSRQGSQKKKGSNSRAHKNSASTNRLRMVPEEQHDRPSDSKLQSTGALGNKASLVSTRSPKTLKIFDVDLDYQVGHRLSKAESIAIDTETDGLDYRKDKLRLVQISTEDGRVYMVRNPIPGTSVNLSLVMLSTIATKIFHHAAFDLRFLKAGIRIEPKGRIECTKTLMKITHPECRSGLGTAIAKLFNVHLNKMAFDHGHWHDEELTREQLSYAANDVLYLHKLLRKLKQDASWADIARYERAMKVIPEKAFMEVEGYTDLWDYPQIGHAKALEQRNWWLDYNRALVKEITDEHA